MSDRGCGSMRWVLWWLLLPAACGEGRGWHTPHYVGFYDFDRGCVLDFELRGQKTRLAISNEGDITFKSAYRKGATDAERMRIVAEIAGSDRMLVMQHIAADRGDPVGFILARQLEAFREACPSSARFIEDKR